MTFESHQSAIGTPISDSENESDKFIDSNQTSQVQSDTVGFMIRNAAKYELLTVEQEIELSKRILVNPKDEEAINTLVEHNQRWAINVATRYTGYGMELADLISVAILGLHRAAQKYDYRRSRFTTYAEWWIKQRIFRALADTSATIRLPNHAYQKVGAINRMRLVLAQELDREPTLEEIAVRMGETVAEVEDFILLTKAAGVISAEFETSLYTQEDYFTIDFRDKANLSPLDRVEALEEVDRICHEFHELLTRIYEAKHYKVFPTLEMRLKHYSIFCMRYGFCRNNFLELRTFDEVRERFGCTKEWVRQVTEKVWARQHGDSRHQNHHWCVDQISRLRILQELAGLDDEEVYGKIFDSPITNGRT